MLFVRNLCREFLILIQTFVFVIMPFEQPRKSAASTGSLQVPSITRSQAQVANDAKVMEFMKAKYVKMEQDLKNAQDELKRLKTRPALATQREGYVLGEMELINRQLECEYDPCTGVPSSIHAFV